MRALDLEVLLRIQELTGETSRTMFFTEEHLAVRLTSFHGIELEEWPAQIAATALHLVEHQANQAMELALGRVDQEGAGWPAAASCAGEWACEDPGAAYRRIARIGRRRAIEYGWCSTRSDGAMFRWSSC